MARRVIVSRFVALLLACVQAASVTGFSWAEARASGAAWSVVGAHVEHPDAPHAFAVHADDCGRCSHLGSLHRPALRERLAPVATLVAHAPLDERFSAPTTSDARGVVLPRAPPSSL